MSFMLGLRIFTVVMMGVVIAHSARIIMLSIAGHGRLTGRALAAEALIALGAFLIGWGLLPGGTPDREWLLMLSGSVVLAVGIVAHPPARVSQDG